MRGACSVTDRSIHSPGDISSSGKGMGLLAFINSPSKNTKLYSLFQVQVPSLRNSQVFTNSVPASIFVPSGMVISLIKPAISQTLWVGSRMALKEDVGLLIDVEIGAWVEFVTGVSIVISVDEISIC